jgi:hypothetical protein
VSLYVQRATTAACAPKPHDRAGPHDVTGASMGLVKRYVHVAGRLNALKRHHSCTSWPAGMSSP